MKPEQMTNDFIKLIEAGHIKPAQMAAVIYAMHAAVMDRFESVAMWIEPDLEKAADSLVVAIRCDERQPEIEAFNPFERKAA